MLCWDDNRITFRIPEMKMWLDNNCWVDQGQSEEIYRREHRKSGYRYKILQWIHIFLKGVLCYSAYHIGLDVHLHQIQIYCCTIYVSITEIIFLFTHISFNICHIK